jgi:UDP-GlcNAc:undecaprenyl-phosphate GlcNAc-1-phosphate transferase
MEYFIIGISSFILGLIFVPLAIKVAFKFNILDVPSTKLKKHEKPIPYLGGVAIFLAFIIPVAVVKFVLHQTFHGIIGIVTGAIIMVIVGLVDDIKNLKPVTKLIFQFLVALILIKVNMNIKFMEHNIFNFILTILWVVGITNSMNLIDIMDGLAGGVAAVASIAFFVIAYLAGRVNDMIPAIALFGAVCAFLIYNKPPAKIYMGDAGSLFLGFMMAALALNESYSRVNYVAVLSPILILGVPIFDTFLVIFLRIKKGLLPIYGSDDHTAQRLVMLGFSKPKATLFLIILTAFLSTVAIISTFLSLSASIVLYLSISFLALMFAMLIMSVDMTDYHKIHKKRK